jgi:uncharacterized protein
MKTTKKTLFLIGTIAICTLSSCSKNDNESTEIQQIEFEIKAIKLPQPTAIDKESRFVNGNWSQSSYATTKLGSKKDSNFLNQYFSQFDNIYLVKDNKSPNSTRNAFISNNNLYFGEALFNEAKSKGKNYIVNQYIMDYISGRVENASLNLPTNAQIKVLPVSAALLADAFALYITIKQAPLSGYSFKEIIEIYNASAKIKNNVVDSNPKLNPTLLQRRATARLIWGISSQAVLGGSEGYNDVFFILFNGALNGTPIKDLDAAISDIFIGRPDNKKELLSYVDEARRILSGKMSEAEFNNLK